VKNCYTNEAYGNVTWGEAKDWTFSAFLEVYAQHDPIHKTKLAGPFLLAYVDGNLRRLWVPMVGPNANRWNSAVSRGESCVALPSQSVMCFTRYLLYVYVG
jgi:hypothetical protein